MLGVARLWLAGRRVIFRLARAVQAGMPIGGHWLLNHLLLDGCKVEDPGRRRQRRGGRLRLPQVKGGRRAEGGQLLPVGGLVGQHDEVARVATRARWKGYGW